MSTETKKTSPQAMIKTKIIPTLEMMNEQQKAAIESIENNKNTLITGPPGTGKSFIIDYLHSVLNSATTFYTSSTGLSAINIGGTTLHSYGALGLGVEPAGILVKKMSKDAKQRWMKTKRLIIDEISMISGELFNLAEEVARKARGNDKPFGGIQLIIFGDFYQLPPVRAMLFAFQSEAWKKCQFQVFELIKEVRQTDVNFIQILREMRRGTCSKKSLNLLQDCKTRTFPVDPDGLIVTKLYPKRFNVENDNEIELSKLPSQTFLFPAEDSGRRIDLLKECQMSKLLKLKKGAIVMLLQNLDLKRGLSNGTQGVVIDIVNVKEYRLKKASEIVDEKIRKREILAVKQSLPIDFGGFPENSTSRKGEWLPIVKFENNIQMMIEHNTATVQVGTETLAVRVQLPLILSWAMTINKSQGMTLNRAQVDVTKAFATGQVYVAISRLRSLGGLKLIGFEPRMVKVDPTVVEYYNAIECKRNSTVDSEKKGWEKENKEKKEKKENKEMSKDAENDFDVFEELDIDIEIENEIQIHSDEKETMNKQSSQNKLKRKRDDDSDQDRNVRARKTQAMETKARS